jgi:hypothetical protein
MKTKLQNKKTITLQWMASPHSSIYDYDMIVTKSNHPKFVVGYRFDFGYFNIATKEGYKIISIPPKIDPSKKN